MSSNPFRRSSLKPQSTISAPPTTFGQSNPNEHDKLHIDTSNIPSFPVRHVSFASPPVNGTIEAPDPQSPESARSPQSQQAPPAVLSYVDYQSAPVPPASFRNFSFGPNRTRATLTERPNTDGYVDYQSEVSGPGQEADVQSASDELVDASRPPSDINEESEASSVSSPRKSIDVDAFARLLLTGRRSSAPSTVKDPISNDLEVSIHSRPNTTQKQLPTPPPTRRGSSKLTPMITSSNPSRRPSVDVRTSQAASSSVNERKLSAFHAPPPPPPPRSTSSSATPTTKSLVPPPLPPPRRSRASSRGSSDGASSPRPSIISATPSMPNETVSQDTLSSSEAQRDSSGRNSKDVLTELASLQKEVDAARRS